MSSRPAPPEPRAAGATRLCLLAAFWLPLAACTWLALTPSPPDPVARLSDVVLHALAFGYLTFALGVAHPAAGTRALIGWMLAYGLGIEVVQSYTAARTAELKDLLVDIVGIAAGLALLRLLAEPLRRGLDSLLAVLLGRSPDRG